MLTPHAAAKLLVLGLLIGVPLPLFETCFMYLVSATRVRSTFVNEFRPK